MSILTSLPGDTPAQPPKSNVMTSLPDEPQVMTSLPEESPQSGIAPAPSPDVLPTLLPHIHRFSKENGVDPTAIATMIGIESAGGRTHAMSSAGAGGIAQFMPDTAKQYGVNIKDDVSSVQGMTKYMRDLVQHYHGDYRLAAMAYNAGQGAIDNWVNGKGSLSSETLAYGAGFEENYERRKRIESQAVHHDGVTAQAPQPPIGHPNAKPQLAGLVAPGTTKTVIDAVKNPVSGAASALTNWTFHKGLPALDAVLGAPQRFVEGMVNETVSHGTIPIGASPQAIMHGFGVALHPFHDRDQETEQKRLVQNVLGAFGLHPSPGNKVLDAIETLGVVTATDPTTYIPALGELKVGSKIVGALKDAHAALPEGHALKGVIDTLVAKSQKMSENQLVQLVKHFTTARPELDDVLTKNGKAVRISIEDRYAHQFSAVSKDNETFMKQWEPQIKAAEAGGHVDPGLRAALEKRGVFEAWAYGSPEMREEAVRLGFKPEEKDLKQFPTPLGVLNDKHVSDYTNLLEHMGPAASSTVDDFRSALGKTHATEYATPKVGRLEKLLSKTDDSLAGRIGSRLNLARQYAQKRLVDEESARTFKAHPEFLKDPNGFDPTKFSHETQIPSELQALGKLTGGFRNLTSASVLGNPLPHGLKNVGMLAYLAGGAPTFFRGLMHAATGNAGKSGTWAREATDFERVALNQRMDQTGLRSDFTREVGGLFAHAPMKQIGEGGQHVVERLENGFRASALELADKVMGPSKDMADEYRKAAFVRQHLGDYKNVNTIVQVFKAIGGPFVAFRLGIVPAAVARSIVRRPGRLESLYREQEAVGQANGGAQFTLGGPVEDASKLVSDPKDFLLSPSTMGVFGEAAQDYDQVHNGQLKPVGLAYGLAGSFIPGVSPLEQLQEGLGGYNPYGKGGKSPQGISPLALGLAAAIGSHFKDAGAVRKSEKFERAATRKEAKTAKKDLNAFADVFTKAGL